MKISELEVSRLLAYSNVSRGTDSGRSTSATTGSPTLLQGLGGDRAEVSSSAQEIQSLKKYIHSLPDVREDRVQALKSQIENGTYHVSGEDIADLIIRRTLADSSSR